MKTRMSEIARISRWIAVMVAVLIIGFVGSAHAQRLCDDGTRPPCKSGGVATSRI